MNTIPKKNKNQDCVPCMAGRSRPTYREQNNNDLSNQVASGSTSHKRVSQHVSKPPVSPTSKQRDPLYEVDSSLLKKLNQGDGEYLVSIKSKIKNHTTAKATVMEHFHRLMKDTLGQRTYMSLVKNGVLNKNLPDELVTRKILDALELKNKLLFSSATTGSAINKLSFIQAVGNFRGALKAARNTTLDEGDQFLEMKVGDKMLKYDGAFLATDKPKAEIKVLGYIGVTNNK